MIFWDGAEVLPITLPQCTDRGGKMVAGFGVGTSNLILKPMLN